MRYAECSWPVHVLPSAPSPEYSAEQPATCVSWDNPLPLSPMEDLEASPMHSSLSISEALYERLHTMFFIFHMYKYLNKSFTTINALKLVTDCFYLRVSNVSYGVFHYRRSNKS